MENTTQDKKKSILLVEDDQLIRELYVRVMQNAGYEVTACEDGEKAFAELSTKTFDLILLDIMLPKMSGIDVLQKLKDTKNPNMQNKIIMLTNLDQDLTIANSLALGASGYVIKSNIVVDKLLEEIKSWLST